MKKLKFSLILFSLAAVPVTAVLNPEALWISLTIFVSVLSVLLFGRFGSGGKHINSAGYVVLSRSSELEHRYIAKQILGRALYGHEVVHHINGKRADNRVWNLCLMDGRKHEHFHAWLSWKKQKSGKYPSIRSQKRILVEEYGGILLEDVPASVRVPSIAASVSNPSVAIRQSTPESGRELDLEIKLTKDQSRLLFVELRKERKRISELRKIPAYMVFHDRALLEMSERAPVSKHAMLEIQSVDRDKYDDYGPNFIEVIRRFMTDLESAQNKRDGTA